MEQFSEEEENTTQTPLRCICIKKDGEQCTRNAFSKYKGDLKYNVCKQHLNMGCGGRITGYKNLDKKANSFNKVEHPPFKEMISKAIFAEREIRGSSLPFIKKYLETNWKILPTNPLINATIRKMLINDDLYRDHIKKGHYHISKTIKAKLTPLAVEKNK